MYMALAWPGGGGSGKEKRFTGLVYSTVCVRRERVKGGGIEFEDRENGAG